MGNFDINTNFNPINNFEKFNNSIKDFNKSFMEGKRELEAGKSSISGNFTDILNSVNKNETKDISPSQKLALDIQNGFKSGITELNASQRKAEDDFETFASGGDISIHEVMISAEKSSLTMQMAIQLRNQMLNAYNEFKNMQI